MTKVSTMSEDRQGLRLESVEQAVADIAAGKAVVVVDDENRENEGDLIFAAEKVTPEMVAFMVRYSSGYICAALTDEAADRLHLPPMVSRNEDARHTAYTVTVDAANGTTGISARNRAETIALLADPKASPEQFTRPGHVVPLRARRGGVLTRDGHTEAAVDLARMAGLQPAGVLCELVSEEHPTEMALGPELRKFADTHGISMISIAQLIAYRRRHETQVELSAPTRLPLRVGSFEAVGIRQLYGPEVEHIALVAGGIDNLKGAEDVPVRVHSECLTGDVFGSLRCDCGDQLEASLSFIAKEGRGVVIYLRGQEGRGIGLLHKLAAYRLQDEGLDTVDANLEQGLPADAREYSVAGHVIRELGIQSFRLMTNNPDKSHALAGYGSIPGQRIGLPITPNEENIAYLRTKRDRMGHDLPTVAEFEASRR